MLTLPFDLPLTPQNGGFFVSRGAGTHPTRRLESHELIFVHSGRLALFEEEDTFVLKPGETLLLSPARRHGGAAPYPPDLSFYWVHFTVHGQKRGREGTTTIPRHAALAVPERLVSLYRRFLDDQGAGRLTPLSGGLLIGLMLAEVAAAQPGPGPANSALAEQANRHIEVHGAEPISTATVARHLRCNPDYLGRVYKRATGQTLTTAIQRRKLRLAEVELLDTTATIAEVAARLGFADARALRQLFQRYHGMSPRAYRQLYTRVHVNTE